MKVVTIDGNDYISVDDVTYKKVGNAFAKLGDRFVTNKGKEYILARVLVEDGWVVALIGPNGNCWGQGIHKPREEARLFSVDDFRRIGTSTDLWEKVND